MGRSRPHRGNRRRGRSGGPRPRGRTITGALVVSRPGAAHVETAEGDFELLARGQREAMNGDEVEVALVERRGTPPRAVVRSVVSRAVETFLGTFAQAGPLGAVTSLDSRIGHDFFVVPEDPSPARLGVGEGDVVVARITEYPTRTSAAVVTIERRVGSVGELDLNIESIVASYGLAGDFSCSVQEQAEKIVADVEGALAADPRRRDLRGELCVTVDPVDARDFDDAVGARRLVGGGYELCVHIADVTHYVGADTPIDNEAKRRTCSAYLVDRVVPMLPERLSNDVCSLRPGEDRLAMSVVMRLDARGHVLGAKMFASAIRSAARLCYDEVDALLDTGAPVAGGEKVAELLRVLDEIRALRERVRQERGAIEFETVEAEVALDDNGHPTGVSVRRRTRATGLIEEAMLLANECVARRLADVEAPAAYRVHEQPIEEDLRTVLQPLRELDVVDGETSAGLLPSKRFLGVPRGRLRPTPRTRSCCARSAGRSTCPRTSATTRWERRRTATSPRRFAATPTCSCTARSRRSLPGASRARR